MEKNTTLMKLELLMQQRNWSVYRLAKESDMPCSSLNNLFQRNTEPTLPTLRKICAGLVSPYLISFLMNIPPTFGILLRRTRRWKDALTISTMISDFFTKMSNSKTETSNELSQIFLSRAANRITVPVKVR